jgi:RNA polymerase sigma-70 factor, ECF subfamily
LASKQEATLAAPAPAPDRGAIQELLEGLELTPACRAVLLLHFEEEMALQEVAAVLELPLGTVKSRLAYGLAAIRRQPNLRRIQ